MAAHDRHADETDKGRAVDEPFVPSEDLEHRVLRLGACAAGARLAIETDPESAYLILLTEDHHEGLRNGRDYHYRGGLTKTSPHTLTVPTDDTWVLVAYGVVERLRSVRVKRLDEDRRTG